MGAPKLRREPCSRGDDCCGYSPCQRKKSKKRKRRGQGTALPALAGDAANAKVTEEVPVKGTKKAPFKREEKGMKETRKAREREEKAALKAEGKMAKDAKKARKKAEKVEKKAEKARVKTEKKAEKAARKADKKLAKATRKALKHAREAEKKIEKSARKAEKKAANEARQAVIAVEKSRRKGTAAGNPAAQGEVNETQPAVKPLRQRPPRSKPVVAKRTPSLGKGDAKTG
jgi:hypothetical protein